MSNSNTGEGDNFMVLAIMTLTAFIVVAVTLSAYLLIDITHVSNLSNIHITKNLLMAANNAKGDLYSNSEKGIKDWIIYTDKQNGFEIKYPSEYKFEKINEGDGRLLSLKASNKTPQGIDSLSTAIYVSLKDSENNISLKDEIEKRGISWDDKWQQQEIGGRPGIRTGPVVDLDGMERELVFWQFGGKIFSLEEYHFNEDSRKEDDIFNKIVSEFNFL